MNPYVAAGMMVFTLVVVWRFAETLEVLLAHPAVPAVARRMFYTAAVLQFLGYGLGLLHRVLA
jgi:hypothetical protein